MNTILCSDCGKVMSRFTTQCTRCTRTNLEFISDPNAIELQKKINRLTGRQVTNYPIISALLVVIAIATVTAGYWSYDRYFAVKLPEPAAVQTASTSAAVTH